MPKKMHDAHLNKGLGCAAGGREDDEESRRHQQHELSPQYIAQFSEDDDNSYYPSADHLKKWEIRSLTNVAK
jgi:hypothetical protein